MSIIGFVNVIAPMSYKSKLKIMMLIFNYYSMLGVCFESNY